MAYLGYNQASLTVPVFWSGALVSQNSTSLVLRNGDYVLTYTSGGGLTYAGTRFASGQIYEISIRQGATLSMGLGGLSANVVVIQSYIDAGNPQALFEYFLEGDDEIGGSSSGDYLSGYIGNDILSGLGGNDTLNGGDGNDTADYWFASAATEVNLYFGWASSDGWGANDTLVDIENIQGGNGVENVLIGNDDDNRLSGSFIYNDTLIGGAGNVPCPPTEAWAEWWAAPATTFCQVKPLRTTSILRQMSALTCSQELLAMGTVIQTF